MSALPGFIIFVLGAGVAALTMSEVILNDAGRAINYSRTCAAFLGGILVCAIGLRLMAH